MHFITYFLWFMLFCGKSAWNSQIFLPFSLVFQPSLLLHPQSNILLWLHTKNHCKFEEIFTVTELPYVAGKYRCQILLNYDTNLKIISTFKRIFDIETTQAKGLFVFELFRRLKDYWSIFYTSGPCIYSRFPLVFVYTFFICVKKRILLYIIETLYYYFCC